MTTSLFAFGVKVQLLTNLSTLEDKAEDGGEINYKTLISYFTSIFFELQTIVQQNFFQRDP